MQTEPQTVVLETGLYYAPISSTDKVESSTRWLLNPFELFFEYKQQWQLKKEVFFNLFSITCSPKKLKKIRRKKRMKRESRDNKEWVSPLRLQHHAAWAVIWGYKMVGHKPCLTLHLLLSPVPWGPHIRKSLHYLTLECFWNGSGEGGCVCGLEGSRNMSAGCTGAQRLAYSADAMTVEWPFCTCMWPKTWDGEGKHCKRGIASHHRSCCLSLFTGLEKPTYLGHTPQVTAMIETEVART